MGETLVAEAGVAYGYEPGEHAWSDAAHGVNVYLDETFVGVATGGHFDLTGLSAGMHVVTIVARDPSGADLDDLHLSDSAGFTVSPVDLASMDLPVPQVLHREQTGQVFKIALVVVATGRYIDHVPLFAESALQHFCSKHHVTILVLTDSSMQLDPRLQDHVRWLRIVAEDWPFPTLKKPHFALSHWEAIAEFDFAFIADADLLFVRPVGIEVWWWWWCWMCLVVVVVDVWWWWWWMWRRRRRRGRRRQRRRRRRS